MSEKGKGTRRFQGEETVRMLRCMFIERRARLAWGT